MQDYYIFAVLSAIFAGLHTFTHKIAAHKSYDSLYLSTLNAFVSFLLSALVVFYLGIDPSSALIGIILGALGGVSHLLGSVVRIDALKYIDSAIYFPLYKTIGPIFTILMGYLLLGERFTSYEWLGLILSLFVPLLLINKQEDKRQNNLKKGLWFVLLSAFLTAVGAYFAKYSTNFLENVIFYVTVSHGFAAASGFVGAYTKGKLQHFLSPDKEEFNLAIAGGVLQFLTFSSFMLAFKYGELAIVYTINSFYILIPIILSVIFYKEHWNIRKVLATVLSIVALWFLK